MSPDGLREGNRSEFGFGERWLKAWRSVWCVNVLARDPTLPGPGIPIFAPCSGLRLENPGQRSEESSSRRTSNGGKNLVFSAEAPCPSKEVAPTWSREFGTSRAALGPMSCAQPREHIEGCRVTPFALKDDPLAWATTAVHGESVSPRRRARHEQCVSWRPTSTLLAVLQRQRRFVTPPSSRHEPSL